MYRRKEKQYKVIFVMVILAVIVVMGCGKGAESNSVMREQNFSEKNSLSQGQENKEDKKKPEEAEAKQGWKNVSGQPENTTEMKAEEDAVEQFNGIQKTQDRYCTSEYQYNNITEQGEDSADTQNNSKNMQILKFVDAWGEWHETEVNPNVKKHPYQWQYLTNEKEILKYEDENFITRKGIDVSHHQGFIDWRQVKEAGYEFVFVRMVYRGYGSEGSLNLDRAYRENILGAQTAGLDVGVYVFSQAVNETEAIEEAQLIIANLQDMSLELPVVFDPELIRDDTARTDEVTGEQFTRNAVAFCEKVKEAGYTPMIYSNMVWEAELFDLEQLWEYPIWYADYEKIPQTPYDFQFWQCSESGIVEGVQGIVDIDVQFLPKP
ncbi:MAG: glycoside hydrolase family 25 protein [Lachnospiraceae bacterium]|nr:glycoside hydrolase family 25 protein [Lachnospiraceae bacterium]